MSEEAKKHLYETNALLSQLKISGAENIYIMYNVFGHLQFVFKDIEENNNDDDSEV
jgi:hypothetical protein